MNYIIINEAFANAHSGYTRDNLVFNYAVTNSGDYVCSENSLTEFPELFEDSPYLYYIMIQTITPDNFPIIP